MKKVVGIVLAISFALILFAGCTSNDGQGQADGERTVVSWSTWGNEGELDRFFQLNDEFEDMYPDIEINFMRNENVTGFLLGNRVLRAETAALTALGCILYEAGDL